MPVMQLFLDKLVKIICYCCLPVRVGGEEMYLDLRQQIRV